MSTTRLPELPPAKDEPMLQDHPYYGATEVHAYGLAVWKAAMQYAAEEADKALTNGRSPLGRLVAQGILALPLPEQGGPQERRE